MSSCSICLIIFFICDFTINKKWIIFLVFSWCLSILISRVLKPNGKLYCVAAFLQPVHAFPDHYFNMTKGGMRLLFEEHLSIDDQTIIKSGLPIFSLTWILQRWIHALPQDSRDNFMSKKVSDLLASPIDYLEENFVKELPEEMNEELASTTALFATKKWIN